MLNQADVQTLCEQALSYSKPYSAEVLIQSVDHALTRFANNAIHQNVSESDISLILRVLDGNRLGSVSTNRTDSDSLAELARQAQLNAKASPEDPNQPGFEPDGVYQPVSSYDAATAEYSPNQRALQVRAACNAASAKGLNASGAFTTGSRMVALANTFGAFRYHTGTISDFQTVVMGTDSSGYAGSSSWKVSDLPVEALGMEAILKAESGRQPRLIPPGEYTVILDPYATHDMLAMLDFQGMGAQNVQEGRSWMNGLIGQQAMHNQVSIWDDGLDPSGIPHPFDYEGVAKQRVEIVSRGTVVSPVYNRTTAHKAGLHSTGHALPPDLRAFSPAATHLFMASGESSLDEMIRSTRRGLYITRFWYTRQVHPKGCLVTGMTRDGVTMIENGELAYPVKNLRFTQSYVQALADIEGIDHETRLLVREYGNIATRVPAVKISRFHFTGSTV